MTRHEFSNRLRSLFNIDADNLPDLTQEQYAAFLVDPVRFFLRREDALSDAIFREVEKRQDGGGEALTIDAIKEHKTLIHDLAWFIENVTEEDPTRSDKFFALRERWRAIQ